MSLSFPRFPLLLGSLLLSASPVWATPERSTALPDWVGQVLVGALLLLAAAIVFIITLRRQVRRATVELRARETSFRKAIEDAPIPIMMHAEDGEILALSSTWCQLSGYTPQDIKTTTAWAEKAYGNDSDKILAEIQQQYELEERKDEGDYVISCRDGSSLVWSFSAVGIGRLADGRRTAISMASDVTERLQREQALYISEERYRQLFEQLLSGFALLEVVFDEQETAIDLRFILVNKRFESLTGLSAAAVTGEKASEVMSGLESYLLERYCQVALTGVPTELEEYLALFDKHFVVRAYSTERGRVAVLFDDITDLKQANQQRSEFIEQLERKNAELERISYTVSHDLKTPLVTVKGFLGYLEEDLAAADEENIQRDINFIKAAADKMMRLLNELLEFTRLGRVEDFPEEIDFRSMVSAVLKPLAGRIESRKVQISLTEGTLKWQADPRRMGEIWQNLIENAIKYMGEQADPHIEIGFQPVDDEIVFFVRDNGIGIEPQYSDKIFNLFEKLDSAVDGTGIGLALVKRIVALYRGRIWVESAGSGAGSTFKFTLPQLVVTAENGGEHA